MKLSNYNGNLIVKKCYISFYKDKDRYIVFVKQYFPINCISANNWAWNSSAFEIRFNFSGGLGSLQ